LTIWPPRPAPRLAALLFCAIALTPAAARAQGAPTSQPAPSEEAKRRAKELFQRAETEYRQGNFTEALADYQATLKLRHHPSIIFNIAQCHRQLKNAERALFFYKLFLADWERVHPGARPPNEAEVLEHVKLLEAELRAAELRARAKPAPQSGGELLLKGVPSGAQVLVDGVLRGQGPITAPIAVAAGKRLVRVEQPGFEGWSRTITIAAARRAGAKVRLLRLVNVGIESQPGGAKVIVDGIERGWTPLRLTLPAERTHALELRKTGYQSLGEQMTLEPRETAWARYRLEPTRELFGTRNEWFAFEGGLVVGAGGAEGFVGGSLAVNTVTLKWKHASWTNLTLGGGGAPGRFFGHMETRLGYPLRFGSRGQHQLRPGLGFGMFAISVDETTRSRLEQAWLQRKDTGENDYEGDGPYISLCVSPAVEYLYQTLGRTLVGGGFRALVPITRSLDRGLDGAPTIILLTARVGWASQL